MPKSDLAVTAIEDFDKEYTIIEKIGQGYLRIVVAERNLLLDPMVLYF